MEYVNLVNILLLGGIYLAGILVARLLTWLYDKYSSRPLHKVLMGRSKKLIWILWPWTLLKLVVILYIVVVCFLGWIALLPLVLICKVLYGNNEI